MILFSQTCQDKSNSKLSMDFKILRNLKTWEIYISNSNLYKNQIPENTQKFFSSSSEKSHLRARQLPYGNITGLTPKDSQFSPAASLSTRAHKYVWSRPAKGKWIAMWRPFCGRLSLLFSWNIQINFQKRKENHIFNDVLAWSSFEHRLRDTSVLPND